MVILKRKEILSEPVQVTIEESLTNTAAMYDLPYTDLTVIKKTVQIILILQMEIRYL